MSSLFRSLVQQIIMSFDLHPSGDARAGVVDEERTNDTSVMNSTSTDRVSGLVEALDTPETNTVASKIVMGETHATLEFNTVAFTDEAALIEAQATPATPATGAVAPIAPSAVSIAAAVNLSQSSATCAAEINTRRSPRKRQKLIYSEDSPFAMLEDHCAQEKRKDQRATLLRGDGDSDAFLDLPEEEFPMQYLHSFLSHADVLRALELIDIPDLQYGRDNVRRNVEDEEVRSLTTGVIPSRREGKICVSEACIQRPALTKLLVEFGKRHIPDRDFRFNAITINEDLETNLHTDRSNLGPSYIIALGDFVGGGELWAHDRGLLDAKHKFQKFDGNVPHKTMPWKSGGRYVLIYYTNKHNCELSNNDKLFLANSLGFRLPLASQCEAPFYRYGFTLPATERLDAARESFTKYMESQSKGSRRISTPGAIIHGIELYKGAQLSRSVFFVFGFSIDIHAINVFVLLL